MEDWEAKVKEVSKEQWDKMTDNQRWPYKLVIFTDGTEHYVSKLSYYRKKREHDDPVGSGKEVAENARRAAIYHAKTVSFNEAIRKFLTSCDGTLPNKEEIVAMGLAPTLQSAMIYKQILRALDGDLDALKFIRDTIGEKPTEKHDLGLQAKPLAAYDLDKLSDEEVMAIAYRNDNLAIETDNTGKLLGYDGTIEQLQEDMTDE